MNIEQGHKWLFELTNFRVHMCDEKTISPVPGDAPKGTLPGWKRNLISFDLPDRQWTLIDYTIPDRPTRDEIEGSTLISGELFTEIKPHDNLDEILETVDILCMLLSFALGRGIAAPDCYKQSDENVTFVRSRSMRMDLYADGGYALIENSRKGQLRSFLECAYPIVLKKKGWWLKTLDFSIQARMSVFLEIQASLSNVLLDRIAAFYPENRVGGEIDETLDEVINDPQFKRQITELIEEYCAGWTQKRTEEYIIQHLANCNKRPSFANGIKRVHRLNNLEEPKGKFLSQRHKLLHEGDLTDGDDDAAKYVNQLFAMTGRLLLKMLGYSGRYYDISSGAYALI